MLLLLLVMVVTLHRGNVMVEAAIKLTRDPSNDMYFVFVSPDRLERMGTEVCDRASMISNEAN